MLRNLTSGAVLATKMRQARSPWERLAGLIGARPLDPEGGLWLEPCGAIHTVGMRFAIDVLLLDPAGFILAIAPNVPPMRPHVTHRGTAIVVELPAGSAARSAIGPGDRLSLA